MTQGFLVSLNEVLWLKHVLYTENGASYDTLLSYWIKCWINAPARYPASQFQPDIEHGSDAIQQLPKDGQLPLNFFRSLSYPNVSFLTVRPVMVR